MLSNDLSIVLIVFVLLEDNSRPQVQSIRRFDRQQGFVRNQMLESYTNKMFRDQMRVNK